MEPQSPTDASDGLRSLMKGLGKKGREGLQKSSKKPVSDAAEEEGKLATSGASIGIVQPSDSYISDSIYDFSHAKRGIALVFVNEFFDPSAQQEARRGAEYDRANYEAAFESLGFQVVLCDNLTVSEIKKTVDAYAGRSFDNEDCFVCAFSTHGDQSPLDQHLQTHIKGTLVSDIIFGRDGTMTITEITERFTDNACPSLSGKPKLFFFQACRGNLLSDTVTIEMNNTYISSSSSGVALLGLKPVEIPLHKDFFMAFSAPPGFYSFRRSKGVRAGSWFVIALLDVIKEYGRQYDLETLMTLVSQEVVHSSEYLSNIKKHPEFNHRKIVPWIASMLVKDVYFLPKS